MFTIDALLGFAIRAAVSLSVMAGFLWLSVAYTDKLIAVNDVEDLFLATEVEVGMSRLNQSCPPASYPVQLDTLIAKGLLGNEWQFKKTDYTVSVETRLVNGAWREPSTITVTYTAKSESEAERLASDAYSVASTTAVFKKPLRQHFNVTHRYKSKQSGCYVTR
ncbi:hypothetical protein OPW39_15785 [Vibrio europaeus]|uniref:hypothetical protein n=1 Tax=Vibrio europaeus TaxID=300876 RepID=UPI00233F14CC|nr:hypothetical protein [Vibrio europaeus]MDC5870269.1 hypothetical protein [Vibrio europaeus]